MRTNIEIDDALMSQAMTATGAATKKAAVEAALRKVVELSKQEAIGKWFGKIQWEGDLTAMREERLPEQESLRGKAKRRRTMRAESTKRKTATAA